MPRELSCAEARALASELLDNLLVDADEAAVKAHVASCGTCPGLYRAMVAARDKMQALGAETEVPAVLAQNVGRALRDARR